MSPLLSMATNMERAIAMKDIREKMKEFEEFYFERDSEEDVLTFSRVMCIESLIRAGLDFGDVHREMAHYHIKDLELMKLFLIARKRAEKPQVTIKDVLRKMGIK